MNDDDVGCGRRKVEPSDRGGLTKCGRRKQHLEGSAAILSQEQRTADGSDENAINIVIRNRNRQRWLGTDPLPVDTAVVTT